MKMKIAWASKPDSLWYITDEEGTRNNIWCGITTSRSKNVQIVGFILGSLLWTIGYFCKGTNDTDMAK
jgi:hypothetical protein